MVTVTRLGAVGVALGRHGIAFSTLFHHDEATAWAELRAFGAAPGAHPLAGAALEMLEQYAAGRPAAMEQFPLDLPNGGVLSRAVWRALRTIPYGEVRTYAWLAEVAGYPAAVRAVGAAVGANPAPLWVPCHRVVGSGGGLRGFGGGLEMKRRLLELEGALPRS